MADRLGRHIILIGFMGSGKSTIGPLLAKQYDCPIYDCDKNIEEISGRSIPAIFKEDGEATFRDIELQALQQLLKQPYGIIMTGGGIVTTEPSRRALKAAASLNIWLKVDFIEAAKRVAQDSVNTRPLFADKTAAEQLLSSRLKWYEEVADESVDTSDKTPAEIVASLQSALAKNETSSLQRCYIIGDPVAHSFSPYLHNSVYRLLDVHEKYVYEAERVTPEDLARAVERMRSPNVRGVSVTVPHKVAVLEYLDAVDPAAQKIGAVNTIVNDNGTLTGYNTDAEGVLLPILQRTGTKDLSGKKVLIIGAGGAARAAACITAQANASVVIANRTIAKATALADAVQGSAISLEEATKQLDTFDIIFNATSVGMGPVDNTETPLPNVSFTKNQIVFDAVYAPHETQLIKDARKDGATIIYGLEMLGTQAIGQIERFTGKKVALETVMELLKARLS